MSETTPGEALPFSAYEDARRRHWDEVAIKTDPYRGWGGYYHRRLEEVYRFHIPPGRRVLEIGCGTGDLLAAVKPSLGVGVDFSGEMIARARRKHPELTFIQADVHELALEGTFDAIVISDLVNDLWDVQRVFQQLRPLAHPRTRVILNTYNRLWEWPLAAAHKVGVARPQLNQNWLTVPDIANLLYLAGFEVMRDWREILWPVRTPLVDSLFNKFLVRMWPFRHAALTNFVLARPQPAPIPSDEPAPIPSDEPMPTVSVIVAARNEEGNVENIFNRVPQMGSGTELIFVEGHSKDDTYGAIERAIASRPGTNTKLFRQPGKGKGDAVRKGFAEAGGDVLMILDADLTVPPEDLPRFYDALVSGKGEFVNGVRLVYPMEERAMRPLNLIGNKFFSLAFSWLLAQPIKDTLCGTKVLRKSDYDMIVANRAYFGDFDPFGDFDLIFGAAKLDLKIVDLPIRYRERVYGDTNIHRWSHGWLLLRMVAFAARRIKFV
ncbi:MAG: bifunctional class I SAM-dependent methyltransferase/glycosyltransferase family 2 protein [Planctomycetota bacterium]|nr:bifunctional class I SAM-dependent methyltransferase/glycosyltransferase family 2 protein [Planctomycetota bacterium]